MAFLQPGTTEFMFSIIRKKCAERGVDFSSFLKEQEDYFNTDKAPSEGYKRIQWSGYYEARQKHGDNLPHFDDIQDFKAWTMDCETKKNNFFDKKIKEAKIQQPELAKSKSKLKTFALDMKLKQEKACQTCAKSICFLEQNCY